MQTPKFFFATARSQYFFKIFIIRNPRMRVVITKRPVQQWNPRQPGNNGESTKQLNQAHIHSVSCHNGSHFSHYKNFVLSTAANNTKKTDK